MTCAAGQLADPPDDRGERLLRRVGVDCRLDEINVQLVAFFDKYEQCVEDEAVDIVDFGFTRARAGPGSEPRARAVYHDMALFLAWLEANIARANGPDAAETVALFQTLVASVRRKYSLAGGP